ncbi:holin family protein [Alphaproteobacteria bacterium KMM 3653]|uniref:Holin family protein n=1 Tax=Harenicola maris TaxID=2841044 RepID=A0AAP2CMU0_9RHOB|nr:holin family protein [Harenicola maris]
MGVIGRFFEFLFGSGRNVLAETAEVFIENAEGAGQREAQARAAVMAQFAGEFALPKKGWFDRFMDALNRVPRPAMAIGTLGMFVAAMVDPIWFAARMQGIALVPDPLWWLLGAIVSFYFGARYQAKGQEFRRDVAGSVAMAQRVTRNLSALDALEGGAEGRPVIQGNPALAEWKREGGEG